MVYSSGTGFAEADELADDVIELERDPEPDSDFEFSCNSCLLDLDPEFTSSATTCTSALKKPYPTF